MPRVPLKKDQKSMTEHDMNSYSSLQSGDKRGTIFLLLPYFVGELSIKSRDNFAQWFAISS